MKSCMIALFEIVQFIDLAKRGSENELFMDESAYDLVNLAHLARPAMNRT